MSSSSHSASLLKLAHHALALRGAAAAEEAERYVRQAIALCPDPASASISGAIAAPGLPRIHPAELHLFLGHVLELQSTPSHLDAALAAYDLSFALSSVPFADPIAPANSSAPASPDTTATPPADFILQGQAHARMNRGNILVKRDRPAEALSAYDEALHFFQQIRAPSPDVRSSIAALWLNRGGANSSTTTAESLTAAIACYQSAIDLLEAAAAQGQTDTSSAAPPPASTGSIPTHSENLLGSARLALAAALLALPAPDLAGALSLGYLVLTTASRCEADHLPSGDLALRARLVICEALGLRLASTPATLHAPGSLATKPEADAAIAGPGEVEPTSGQKRQWLNESTDRAEEALRHAAGWERRGIGSFRPSVNWFLRFAATLYAQFQPQFLAEFLHEFLCSEAAPPAWADAPDLREIALDSIARARSGLHTRLFERPAAGEAEPLAEALHALQEMHERFRADK
jgi:tetratricopeptide (TPR) repeat protein